MHNFKLSKFDNLHQHYQFNVIGTSFDTSVLKFVSQESLSEPYEYAIEFTSSNKDINPAEVLNNQANFSLFERFDSSKMSLNAFGDPEIVFEPVRKVYGAITQFERIAASKDEAHYRATLKPHLALLDNALNSAIYQDMTVMEVVAFILKSHSFIQAHFKDNTAQNYPKREFHCQWQESDLAFIKRITAEVGIWFRFEMDEKIHHEVVVFADDNSQLVFGTSLPYVSPSSLEDNGVDSVWEITTEHSVVPLSARHKSYAYQSPSDPLLVEGILVPESPERYGKPYHYDELYHELGENLKESTPESGQFYANLQHERYLNEQSKILGRSSCCRLKPGDMLDILDIEGLVGDSLPKSVSKGIIITRVMSVPVGRDRSFEILFEALPYSAEYTYRPKSQARPTISGTIPATVSSRNEEDTYAWLDEHGRYRVKFNFDLNTSWKKGFESLWVRMAKPYSGDTYGFHFPLIDGAEVAIAFAQGDPDRPYIAYAMHNFKKSDHVTKTNNTRNVIRTPANNKLRMEDKRGEEHLKLNTEYGKTQLNLGHLVDSQREKRGEGFELRTDEWGAIRAGKGLFISVDKQFKSQGKVLDMQEALEQIELANRQMQFLHDAAEQAQAVSSDIETQLAVVSTRLKTLQSAVLFASAPSGIALTSGEHMQLTADKNIMINSGQNADIGVMKSFFIGVGQAFGVFVHKLGMKLIANQGKVTIQAQNDAIEMAAKQTFHITSTENEIIIASPKKITLNAGGSYLKMTEDGIEYGTTGEIILRASEVHILGPNAEHNPLPSMSIVPCSPCQKFTFS